MLLRKLWIAVLLLAGQPTAHGALKYTIAKLSGEPAVAALINDHGQAVVNLAGDGLSQGEVIYIDDGTYTRIPFPEGSAPSAGAINNQGQAVG